LRIGADGLEIRRRDADAVVAQIRSGMNPAAAGTAVKVASTIGKRE